jgi:tetratricopeptide (TPR) repeat protein
VDAGALAAVMAEAMPHRVAGRYDEAEALYARVEAASPDAAFFIVLMDLARGRLAPALKRLPPLTRRAARFDQVWEALAHVRRELGQWREAEAASRRVLALSPGHVGERFELARTLEVLGRIDEAVALLRELANAPAARIGALIRLASLSPTEIGPGERAEIATAASDADADAERRAMAGFALGELMERDGRNDEAFAAFAAANRLRRAGLAGEIETLPLRAIGPPVRRLDPAEAERRHIGEIGLIRAVFTPSFLADHAGGGHHLASPIFIVGMPRSGSTLIEQILSSHGKVQGLGETTTLMETLSGHYPYDVTKAEQPAQFPRLAEAYLAAMHQRGWTSAPRFVDKLLRNYMHVGAIHLMFPRAVILHAVRDPVDTCLANFRQNFATGNELSYDLGDIGREYVRYREMMAVWEELLPGRVTSVSHEALVAAPEARIRWLVSEACGLAWDPACLDFHRTRRAVRTASVAQVRRPIFSTSIQRWRRYEKHLGPLFDALGPYAPADI